NLLNQQQVHMTSDCKCGHVCQCKPYYRPRRPSCSLLSLTDAIRGHCHHHRPSSARVLSKVCRPLPVVNRGRDAKGLLLWLVLAGARRIFVLIAGGSTSLPGDRGCTGASDRAAPLDCCASVNWGVTATGLLILSGNVSIAA